MKLTRITSDNRIKFLPFLFGAAQEESPTVLKIGVLDDRNRIAGAIAAETGGRYLEILSLYVLPQFRRKGYGRFLLDTFIGLADPEDYGAVSAVFTQDDDLNPFFSKMGFELFPSSGQYSFTIGELNSSRIAQRYISNREYKNIKRINELRKSELEMVREYLAKSMLPLGGWYDSDWSTVNIIGGRVSSMLLAGMGSNGIALIWLYSKTPAPNEPIQHMRALWSKTSEEYPNDNNIKIRFVAENARILDFTSGILGGVSHLAWESRIVQAICSIKEK